MRYKTIIVLAGMPLGGFPDSEQRASETAEIITKRLNEEAAHGWKPILQSVMPDRGASGHDGIIITTLSRPDDQAGA